MSSCDAVGSNKAAKADKNVKAKQTKAESKGNGARAAKRSAAKEPVLLIVYKNHGSCARTFRTKLLGRPRFAST